MDIDTVIRLVGQELSLRRFPEHLEITFPFSFPSRLTLTVREKRDGLVFSDRGAVLRALAERVGDLAPYRARLDEILSSSDFLHLAGGQTLEWNGFFTGGSYPYLLFFDFVKVLTVIAQLDLMPKTERESQEVE